MIQHAVCIISGELIFSLWLSKPFARHLTTDQWNEYIFRFQG
jgi:hypothetical protein